MIFLRVVHVLLDRLWKNRRKGRRAGLEYIVVDRLNDARECRVRQPPDHERVQPAVSKQPQERIHRKNYDGVVLDARKGGFPTISLSRSRRLLPGKFVEGEKSVDECILFNYFKIIF